MTRWIEKVSAHPVTETLQRLESGLLERGWTVMARVDHAGQAAKAGLELRPTQVLLFGNPGLGTRLMQADQTVAIDLPSKALAWQDSDGVVRLGYRDLRSFAAEHPSLAPAGAAVEELASVIDEVTDTAARA